MIWHDPTRPEDEYEGDYEDIDDMVELWWDAEAEGPDETGAEDRAVPLRERRPAAVPAERLHGRHRGVRLEQLGHADHRPAGRRDPARVPVAGGLEGGRAGHEAWGVPAAGPAAPPVRSSPMSDKTYVVRTYGC